MGMRELTVVRFEEIRRLLAERRPVREIARALKCSRDTVREIRDGTTVSPAIPKALPGPLWTEAIAWGEVITELGLGHPLKFIWEEKAQSLTTYPNFWKQFYKKYPQYKQGTVTLREFEPGSRCEVDYAGDSIEWLDLKNGEIRAAWIFVGALGFSQLLFAWAADDMKSRNWLHSHRKMFESFSGVTQVTVPDCLKQGVSKCHLYDPDLNPSYSTLATHYQTAIVPARPAHPKDKAIAEGAVKILMRTFRWIHRRHTFTSITEINRALESVVDRINRKPHTRFRVSRLERFETIEKAALKPLPETPYETAEWRQAKVHPDCCIGVESAHYSVPHIHRGKQVRVKITENQVEIYLDGERIAVHARDRHRCGNRVINSEHLPPNSRAYREVTPQNLLSQSRFICSELNELIEELFAEDTMGHLRRAQGLIRTCVNEMNSTSQSEALPNIRAAIAQMKRFQKIRVAYFQDCLKQQRKKRLGSGGEQEILRLPGNPMLRYTAARAASPEQIQMKEKESV